MTRFLISWLLRRRGQWLLLVVNALLLTVALIVFNIGSESATLTADQELRRYWRTTYDLLVRSPSSVGGLEKEYGLIRANHLSGTPGGITMEQYELIRDLPDVEIAAPIAMLGYIPRPEIMVGIRDPFPTGIYRVQASSTVVAGLDKQKMDLGPYYALFLQVDADEFPNQEIRDALTREKSRLSLSSAGTGWLGFTIDAPHFDDRALVAAVDPEAEADLLRLDEMVVAGSYFPQGQTMLGEIGDFPVFPVLLNIHDYIEEELTIHIEQVEVDGFPSDVGSYSQELVDSLTAIANQETIENAPRSLIYRETVPVGREWRKVGLAIQLYGDEILEPQRWTSEFIGDVLAPSRVDYAPVRSGTESASTAGLSLEAVPQGVTETVENFHEVIQFIPEQEIAPEAQKLWSREPETVYRQLEPRFDSSLRLSVELLGSFEIDPLLPLRGASPNQVPLETYLPPTAEIVRNNEGDLLNTSVELRPTLNYEGYLVPPPDVLMDIGHVPELLQRSCALYEPLSKETPPYWSLEPTECTPEFDDFISAIRIRVAEINEITPEAQVKIESLAEQITEETQLHVDIMVGSSPESVMVHLPGYGASPGEGYVREPWVKKNVQTMIRVGLTRAEGFLFGAMILSAMSFLFSANFLSFTERTQEFGLLQSLGWRTRDLFVALISEAAFLGAISGALGAALAWLVIEVFGFPAVSAGPIWLVPTGSFFFIAGALIPAWRAIERPPMESLAEGEVESAGLKTRVTSLPSYALSGLLRQPARAIITAVGLALSAAIIVFLKLTLDELGGALYGTLLGQWIRIEIQPFHLAMALVALLSALSALSMATLLNVARRSRESELLRAIGWRNAHIARLFIWESLLLASVSSAMGTLFGAVAHIGLYGFPVLAFGELMELLSLGVFIPSALAIAFSIFPTSRAIWSLGSPSLRSSIHWRNERKAGAATSVLGAVGLILAASIATYGAFFWQPDTRTGLESTLVSQEQDAAEPQEHHIDRVELATAEEADVAIYYDIDLGANIGDRALAGRSFATFENREEDLIGELRFLLYPNIPYPGAPDYGAAEGPLKVTAVSVLGNPRPFRISPNGWELVVPLQNPLMNGEEITVELEFQYSLPNFEQPLEAPVFLDAFFPVLATRQDGKWITNICSLCDDRVYSPPFTANLDIRMPVGILPISAGVVTSSSEEGIYSVQAEAVQDLALVLINKMDPETEVVNGIPVHVYSILNTADPQQVADKAVEVFGNMERSLGKFPYDELNVVVHPADIAGGISRAGIVRVGVGNLDAEFEHHLALNIAYQWISSVQIDPVRHPWMKPALAEFLALRYLAEEHPNSEYAISRWNELRSAMQFRQSLAGQTIPLDQAADEYEDDILLYFGIVWGKGSLFLDALEDYSGPENFEDSVQLFFEHYRNKQAGPRDFLAAMEAVSAEDFGPLFVDWGAIDTDG